MTEATATRIVDRALSTGEASERIQAAAIQGQIRTMSPLAFAEYVGDLLETRDPKLCLSAMWAIQIKRGEA